jgi:hypothetical protein
VDRPICGQLKKTSKPWTVWLDRGPGRKVGGVDGQVSKSSALTLFPEAYQPVRSFESTLLLDVKHLTADGLKLEHNEELQCSIPEIAGGRRKVKGSLQFPLG